MKYWLARRMTRVGGIAVVVAALVAAQGAVGRGDTGASGGRGGGRGNGMATDFDPHNISGYWELGAENKSIPPAVLAPTVTKAVLDKVALADAISLRWCKPLGLPAVMDNGRPIDIQQGSGRF